ncbi:drug/metabolite transporter (DMT)-like permease [Sphingomonas sp. F9_3S_D5_B_2]
MKPEDRRAFERNREEAPAAGSGDAGNMIRTQMNGRDWGIMLVLAAIWGAAFFFIGVAVRHVAPLTYVWLRLTIASSGLWIYLWVRGEKAGLPRSIWGSIVLLALLNNSVPFVLIGWGEIHIASGLAAILNATTPIMGVVVAHFFTQDERMSVRKLAGVLLGVAGVMVMVGPSILTQVGDNALAQLACLAASLSYALAAVWARRFKKLGVSPIGVTTGQLTAGALMLFPLMMIVDRPWTRPAPPLGAWAAIAALALLCTAFAYVLYFRLLQRAGATNAMLVTLIVPPIAILLGGLFLHEALTAQDFGGLLLIALGLAAIDGRLLQLLGRLRGSSPSLALPEAE